MDGVYTHLGIILSFSTSPRELWRICNRARNNLLNFIVGNHFDDTASTIDTASVYDLKARRHDDDEETVDETLSLASVPVGRSAIGDRNYGEETDGLGINDSRDAETELPAHACAFVPLVYRSYLNLY
ncbi:hypothetical protein B9Z19DRAFT_1066890 [Tuber borchii]|uniref:Uncharacterized protein n=1 Tax=Tuber borchii TaxID=42251 RepID=A0A2T6ZKT5_TUBBO|nr:hypothetical protein B9Z19DRAFT_1066890 [Tuber borchii]